MDTGLEVLDVLAGPVAELSSHWGRKEAHTEYLLWVGGQESLVFADDTVEGLYMSAQDIVILPIGLQNVPAGRKRREGLDTFVHLRSRGGAGFAATARMVGRVLEAAR